MLISARSLVIISAFCFNSLFSVTATADQKPLVLTALGDSISTGFNASAMGDNRSLSWGSGDSTSMTSHKQLLEKTGLTVNTLNIAKAGAKVAQLSTQIDQAISNSSDYVTLTIGANDLCSWPAEHQANLADFTTTLSQQMDRLIKERPDVTVILSPVPDLGNLYEIASKQSLCQQRWDLFNICKPLLASQRTPEERQSFENRWHDINKAIESVADQYPENIDFSMNVATTPFTLEHVSGIDCFHPSISGQSLLAENTWPTNTPPALKRWLNGAHP